MHKTIETILGDTEGVAFTFPVFRFDGSDPAAPKAYLQAALHAGELPGTVAIDALMPKLRKAEAEGRLRGTITIVPHANPVGRAQYHFGSLHGRFHLGTRTNFNRDFPLLDRPDASTLRDGGVTVDQRLKQRLLKLSTGHEIVLDLHCDDEGVDYLYVPKALWPGMQDCAAAMGVAAVILWEGSSGASFDEASLHPYLQMPAAEARLERRAIATVEYRGLLDVDRSLAQSDADGLYRLLVARGVIEDQALPALDSFAGLVAPIDHVEVATAPRAGAILFDVKPGDRVKKGDRLATIVHAPGEEGGSTDVLAPQAGYILTRVVRRSTYAGDDLVKLVGEAPSASARQGALEN
ncbi:succinylglutamate desuccinylase/aspartoacylase family protein [Mesorhizobium sp. LHD-90]|uniref:succinylglutamate desuccinylase/aspartoacylase domain-containing protein n=1 Tax=Mesorhizobium sp. LHD-90 TaxID=3071414 RepID=UPI0027DFB1F4|nr:succinylglutamate desuccinylase/aspartoacylase family protein [Mesorhizobium sp. LHD-90]MDQ6436787.1 succinylglutamate desuccinylase/aspartoacylase family protein [Mesorhizobium sp. LHD-90]